MSFVDELFSQMERSTAGSKETVNAVLSRCSEAIGDFAFFVGDELVTPRAIAKCFDSLFVGITEQLRAQKALAEFSQAKLVGQFELPKKSGGYDFGWYNTAAEFESAAARLAAMRECISAGGTAVFRALCWLIEPSPDTAAFCKRRFGAIKPLDEVIREAREQGFKVEDFYIAPKTDWTDGFYKPLLERANDFESQRNEYGEVDAGLREIKREADMFALHCEEYSYVYYILKG